MTWFLYTLAAIGMLALGVLALIYWKLIHPMLKGIRDAKKSMGIDAFSDVEDIELAAELSASNSLIWAAHQTEWESPDKINAKAAELEYIGFREHGTYHGFAPFGVMLLLLDPKGIVAMIGEFSDDHSIHCDLMCFLENGKLVCITDRQKASIASLFQDELCIHRYSETTEHLYQSIMENISGKPLEKIQHEGLIRRLEALQSQRAWHIAEQPSIIDSWLNTQKEEGACTGFSVKQSLSNIITECCRLQYARESTMSAEQWERIRERLVIVHDQGMAIDHEDNFTLSSTDYFENICKPMTIADFEHLNASLPEYSRHKLLGKIHTPTQAMIYLKP